MYYYYYYKRSAKKANICRQYLLTDQSVGFSMINSTFHTYISSFLVQVHVRDVCCMDLNSEE